MSTVKSKIEQLARAGFKETVAIRRHLHQHPELSFEEVLTGRFIASKLSEMGIEHSHGMAGNGVVAVIRGNKPESKVIALRGDMDALPIKEANEVSYRSKNEGVMHACGHDVHTASLLATAKILHSIRNDFDGTIKLIFQPGEEKSPGGASIMIKEGVLENPAPELIIGQHVHPSLQTGKVGMRPGIYMASADELYLTIKGRGGHAAMPQDCIDPIAVAAQILVGLQQLVSRFADPTIPTVLSFGKIHSEGGATNVIPTEVKIEGTFRTMNEAWREKAHKKMKKLAIGIAESFGAACEFNIISGYPVLHNNESLTTKVMEFAQEYLGAENVETLPIRMTAEDFAFYAQEIPACFYRLGTGNPDKNITAPVHSANFDIDEDSLLIAAGTMAYLAIRLLEK